MALWNGTLDQTKVDGSALLDRTGVPLLGRAHRRHLAGPRVPGGRLALEHRAASGPAIGAGADWPDDEQWAAHCADRLAVREYPLDGPVTVELPSPSVVLVEVVRAG